jgi:hypothetical protein
MFFHEYASHVYVPRIECRTFVEGWMMYAIDLFMKEERWSVLVRTFPLISAQIDVLVDWLPHMRLMLKGYSLAREVDRVIGHDKFMQFTWDLASYPYDFAGSKSFHDDFIVRIRKFVRRDKEDSLRAAAQASTEAFQLYQSLGNVQ